MGAEFSQPVSPAKDLGMFCLIFCPWDKVRLLHAPAAVVAVVRRVVNQINSIQNRSDMQTPEKEKLGAVQFTMVGNLFTTNNGKESATMGKLLCIRLFEELFKLGYELDLSSDLARYRWQASTLFFRKTSYERPGARVICVAPGKRDRISLMNHDERSKNAVIEAIKETWPEGLQNVEDVEVQGQTVHEIKMHGHPWFASEANIDNNRIINRIIGNLSQINLRFVAGIDIKGGTDSLFFIEDPNSSLESPQFASISLCSSDRLRLVDCKDEADAVRQTILQNLHQIQDESVRDHHAKFKLRGTPWRCSGEEAVRARQLVSRISEMMLQRGWALTDAIDISRREDDKSMLLFRRCAPTAARFSCIALTSSDHLRLVDFPPGDLEVLQECLSRNYLPGMTKIDTSETGSVKATLAGNPWSHPGGSNLGWALHARSLLLHLLAAATRLGYRVLVSADVSAKFHRDKDNHPDYPLDVHTIYMVKLAGGGEEKHREQPPSYMAATMFD